MVKLISITPKVEELITYCARVSSPKNQDNFETAPKLLNYCIKNGHWSIFEMGNMCLEIETTRAIAAQILRHKSFSFQEFSQRYSESSNYISCKARRQDIKNRQNSLDDLSEDDKIWFRNIQEDVWKNSYNLYQESLKRGIAKECARMLLPLNTTTKLYMNGNIRSWLHYINLRSDKSTQLEHREIADECKKIFIEQLPSIAKSMEWV